MKSRYNKEIIPRFVRVIKPINLSKKINKASCFFKTLLLFGDRSLDKSPTIIDGSILFSTKPLAVRTKKFLNEKFNRFEFENSSTHNFHLRLT